MQGHHGHSAVDGLGIAMITSATVILSRFWLSYVKGRPGPAESAGSATDPEEQAGVYVASNWYKALFWVVMSLGGLAPFAIILVAPTSPLGETLQFLLFMCAVFSPLTIIGALGIYQTRTARATLTPLGVEFVIGRKVTRYAWTEIETIWAYDYHLNMKLDTGKKVAIPMYFRHAKRFYASVNDYHRRYRREPTG